MRTPALAIAWGIWRGHRFGFTASVAMLMILALTYPVLFAYTRELAVLVISTLPLVGLFGYVLNALLFSAEPGSLVAGYPRSMLVLPVRTHTLVFWPMLYGSLGSALLWCATAVLVYRPSGYPVPIFLPGLALAASMAWINALAWMPIAAHWFRVVVILVAIQALGMLPGWLFVDAWVSQTAITVLLACYLGAAYALGIVAVESERRGDAWRLWGWLSLSDAVARRSVRRRGRKPFDSPTTAQFWYEWKCHGWFLPGFVWFFELFLCGLAMSIRNRDVWLVVPLYLGTFLGFPVVFAAAAGPGLGRLRPTWIQKAYQFNTFVAVRPMTSGELVAAKFRMALASALLTWAITAAMTMFWLVGSGNVWRLFELVRRLLSIHPGWRGPAILGLGVVILPALTWKFLTEGVAMVLTGRRWLADGAALFFTSLLMGVTAGVVWVALHPEYLPRLIAAVPVLVASAAIVKANVVVASFRAALRDRLIRWSTFWSALGLWLVLTLCAVAMAVLTLPPGIMPVSRPIMFVGIATLMPLGRYPLATLALEWNRHR
jgi:hypothetical protein